MSKKQSLDRRDFLKLAVTGAVLQQVSGVYSVTTSDTVSVAEKSASGLNERTVDADTLKMLRSGAQCHWLGRDFWGNRLQDWRLSDGRIECVCDVKGPDLRTVSLLTREMALGKTAGSIRATIGRISPKGKGFGGFLIGAGAGKLDYRAAALVQKSSGENGGMLCVIDTEGRTSFREHSDEDQPFLYGEIPSKTAAGQATYGGGEVNLVLDIMPDAVGGTFTLTLKAEENGVVVSTSTLPGISDAALTGGVMLVSASTSGPDGARYWFRDIDTTGEKITPQPERALGPVLGTLFSLNGPVMKLSAQLMPVAPTDPQEATLLVRADDAAEWRTLASQKLGSGFCATFRVENWDDTQDWQYRVAYAEDGTGNGRAANYDGIIRRDPRHGRRQFSIGLHSCTTATSRDLDGGSVGLRKLPQSRHLGRYTGDNIYFPYAETVKAAHHHNADMLVFAGDQFYESSPTPKAMDDAPLLDYLYKYYLWLWSHRELTRDRPTLVLVDDHDVYQGNLWGTSGRPAPEKNQDLGGYVKAAEWVNMVQQTQCGHNPDPWDPTPVKQGIGVYYCAFSYGGAEFCLLEDRKFKTGPVEGASLNAHVSELLGDRQEKFIAEWGAKVKDAEARICLTATVLACAQTSPEGLPFTDVDSNGYPPLARTHAVRLLREANVLVLSGDQHLGSVIRLGDETFTDGPITFSGPAGSTSWTRWFEPATPLANAGDTPNTGDFQDAYSNRMRVLAVANPSISFAEYREHIKGRSQAIGDRNLKAEGYGIVNVDLDKRSYKLECWRWDADPAAPDAKQYAGWPMTFGFDEVARA